MGLRERCDGTDKVGSGETSWTLKDETDGLGKFRGFIKYRKLFKEDVRRRFLFNGQDRSNGFTTNKTVVMKSLLTRLQLIL